MNAHSHLMAMMLSTSEVIPIVDGQLALGTWQSILFLSWMVLGKGLYLYRLAVSEMS
jgi:thiamine phosphate synthase YjbQ (UPF0047 family)